MELTENYICEICNCKYENGIRAERRRISNRKTFRGRSCCKECVKKESKRIFSEAGKMALSRISVADRIKNARTAGLASGLVANSGRFTTERWNNLSADEQRDQVTKANAGLHKKLNANPDLKHEHYKKVHAQKGIGYISSGHKELHIALKDFGFETHGVISSMEVDECNLDLKIVVEYNGDYWHCNPTTWGANQFNKSIKMFAEEKWKADKNRQLFLESLGYSVIVVWENEWKTNKQKYIKLIHNEIDKKEKNLKT